MNKTFTFGEDSAPAVTDRAGDDADYFSGMKILGGRPSRESDHLAATLEALDDRDQGIDPSERAFTRREFQLREAMIGDELRGVPEAHRLRLREELANVHEPDAVRKHVGDYVSAFIAPRVRGHVGKITFNFTGDD